jgi:hypothetical protein
MEVMCSFETSVHIRTTQHCIPEDDNIHNYHCENLSSYNTVWFIDVTVSLCRCSFITKISNMTFLILDWCILLR